MQSYTVYVLVPSAASSDYLEGKTITIDARSAAEAEEIAKQQYPNSRIEVEE